VNITRILAVIAALAGGMIFAAPGNAAESGKTPDHAKTAVLAKPAEASKTHHIAIQVDQNDPALMNLVLNNVANLTEYYHSKGEQAQVEVVAYGPGLNMLRDDKSPVKDRLKRIKDGSFPSTVTFSACGNTKKGMEKAEGHPIAIVPEARVVPAGVVRLTELQEKGWSYIRP
jgi:intracellular sulfur oxidation DsrE/DsrF family protein